MLTRYGLYYIKVVKSAVPRSRKEGHLRGKGREGERMLVVIGKAEGEFPYFLSLGRDWWPCCCCVSWKGGHVGSGLHSVGRSVGRVLR